MPASSNWKGIWPLAAAAIVLVVVAGWQVAGLVRSTRNLGDLRLSLDEAKSGVEELEYKLRLLDEEIAKMGFVKVDLYFTRVTDTALKVVSMKKVVEKGDNLPFNAMEALMEGPHGDADLYAPVPEGVKVLSVTTKSDIAYVDFSEEIMYAGFGSEGELAMVSCIVNTLVSLPGIGKAQILVEGEKVESLGGHVFVGSPLSRMSDLL